MTCHHQGPHCDGGHVEGYVKVWTWHNRYVEVPACTACLTHDDSREPDDEQTFNGPGTEGGINFLSGERR